MKYYAQTSAPSGNWVDVLGTDDMAVAQSYCTHSQNKTGSGRVVERSDHVVQTPHTMFDKDNWRGARLLLAYPFEFYNCSPSQRNLMNDVAETIGAHSGYSAGRIADLILAYQAGHQKKLMTLAKEKNYA